MTDSGRISQPLYDQETCPPGSLGDVGPDTPSSQAELLALIPNLEFPPDPKLAAEGWQRRFMADPVRVQETIQLYTELGYEVRVEEIKPTELSAVCGDCRLATCRVYVTIYTRKPSL